MAKGTKPPKGATRYFETAFGILPKKKLVELEAEGVAKGLLWIIRHAKNKPAITAELLLDLHKRCFKFIVSVAAWMQHWIVWIHPFLDYNGRIARLATNLFFLEYGLPLVEIPAEKSGNIRNQYVAAMQAADQGQGDLRPLEKLLWKALQEER